MIQFIDYTFSYAQSKKNVLEHIDLEIPENKITVLCGKSGSGKTTLLKSMKEEIAPVGSSSGKIVKGLPSNEIAMVFQNPDAQLLCGSVLNDLAFGMENRGLSQKIMRKRMAETVCFFGIEPLLNKSPETLSGGQKQLIALCSAMMMHPKLLILDEPLSQLDPIAQTDFLEMLKRINEEFSITIVLSEHKLHEVLSFADQIGIMKDGNISYFGEPKQVLRDIYECDEKEFMYFIPDVTKTSLKLFNKVALMPRELKEMVQDVSYKKKMSVDNETENIVTCRDIVYSYPHSDSYVLKRLSIEIKKRELSCVFGGNGSGKSTFLKLLTGVLKGYSGKIKNWAKSIGYVPQNVHAYFVHETVKDEIWFSGCDETYYHDLITKLYLENLLKHHPYDISGGEAERVVLASVLLRKPELIILDELTKGLDPESKEIVATLLKESHSTIFMATHDIEFASKYADYCYMLFDGDIAYDDKAENFFKENRYYTTSINKAFRHVCSEMITYEDVLKL